MKLIFATALAAVFAMPALAAPNCAATPDVYDILDQKYAESRRAAGISKNGYILEIWANDETGTWTVIATNPSGQSCILDEGEGFGEIPAPIVGDPA